MPRVKIVPAILARTAREARRQINRLSSLYVPIHLDLMDGKFVSTKSFGPQTLSKLHLPRGSEAHCMVMRPADWIVACTRAGIHRLILHLESKITPKFVDKIKSQFSVTLALKPRTSLDRLRPYLRATQHIQVMTVIPGRQGNPFLQSQLKVVRELRRKFRRLRIIVDGGMTEKTIPPALTAGANEIVVGSALRNSKNPVRAYQRMVKSLKGGDG